MKTSVLILGLLAAIGCGTVTARSTDDGGIDGAPATGGAQAAGAAGGIGGMVSQGAGGIISTGGTTGAGGTGACGGNVCPGGQTCQNDRCQCGTGQLFCSGLCVEIGASHCGSCSTTCTIPQVCSNSSCTSVITGTGGTGGGGGKAAGGSSGSGGQAGVPAAYPACYPNYSDSGFVQYCVSNSGSSVYINGSVNLQCVQCTTTTQQPPPCMSTFNTVCVRSCSDCTPNG